MVSTFDAQHAIIETWEINNRITIFLLENLPDELWPETVPGAPRRTVRMIAGHLHNCRCMWIKMSGRKHGLQVPKSVDRRRVTRRQLLPALRRSSRGMVTLLELGLERGGKVPNFPGDVLRFLTYHTSHEAHHRGQIAMLARQLGHRLPGHVTNGLWHWSKRAKEIDR